MKSTVTVEGLKSKPHTMLYKKPTSGNIYYKLNRTNQYVRIYAPDEISYPLGDIETHIISPNDLEPFYGILVLNSQE